MIMQESFLTSRLSFVMLAMIMVAFPFAIYLALRWHGRLNPRKVALRVILPLMVVVMGVLLMRQPQILVMLIVEITLLVFAVLWNGRGYRPQVAVAWAVASTAVILLVSIYNSGRGLRSLAGLNYQLRESSLNVLAIISAIWLVLGILSAIYLFSQMPGQIFEAIERFLGGFAATPSATKGADRDRIMRMIEDGKITADEGSSLLDALGRSNALHGEERFAPGDLVTLCGTALVTLGFFLPWAKVTIPGLMDIKGISGYQAGYHTGAIGWAVMIIALLASMPVFITPRQMLYKLTMLQIFLAALGSMIVHRLNHRVRKRGNQAVRNNRPMSLVTHSTK